MRAIKQNKQQIWTFLGGASIFTLLAANPTMALPPGPDPDHPDIELVVHEEGTDKHIESTIPMWYSVSPESRFAFRSDLGGIATASPGYPGFGAGEHDHGAGGHGHDHEPFDPSVTLSLTPSTTLRTWNPVTGMFEAADNERVEIFKASGPGNIFHTIIGGSSITTGSMDSDGQIIVQIGTTDSTGGLHAHLLWYLTSSSGPADFGAYLVEIVISAPGYEDSEPLPVLFNYGLSDSAFTSAIWGAAALYAIPEPTTGLILAGLGGLAMLRRRRLA